MDVGAPSNLERLRHRHVDADNAVTADWVDDATIRDEIVVTLREDRTVVCPHTACGLAVLRRLRAEGERGTWIVAATAHPAKFDTVVEPLIGERVPVPPALAAILARPASSQPLAADLVALAAALR
jgi:threonine synthase